MFLKENGDRRIAEIKHGIDGAIERGAKERSTKMFRKCSQK